MRFTLALLAMVAALAIAGCSQARMSPQAALAQSGYVASARSAVDGSPGLTGPQEIVAVYLPFGPFAVKGGIVWDGQPLVIENPIGAQAAPYDACAQTAPAGPCGDPFAAPAPQAAPTGRWVWTE